jgi:hypothetical protein
VKVRVGKGFGKAIREILKWYIYNVLSCSLSPWINNGCRSVVFIKLRFQNRLVIKIKELLNL